MKKLCIVVLVLFALVYAAYGTAAVCSTPGCTGVSDDNHGNGQEQLPGAPGGNPQQGPGGISVLSAAEEEHVLAIKTPNIDSDEFDALPNAINDEATSEIVATAGNYAVGKKCVTDCAFFGDSRFKEPFCNACAEKSKHFIVYTPAQPKCYNLPADIKSGLVKSEDLNKIKALCAQACTCVNVVFSDENTSYISVLADKIKAASQVIFKQVSDRLTAMARAMAKASEKINMILTASKWQNVSRAQKECANGVQGELGKRSAVINKLYQEITAKVNVKIAEITKVIDASNNDGAAEDAVTKAIQEIGRMYKPLNDAFQEFTKYITSSGVQSCINLVKKYVAIRIKVMRKKAQKRQQSRQNRRDAIKDKAKKLKNKGSKGGYRNRAGGNLKQARGNKGPKGGKNSGKGQRNRGNSGRGGKNNGGKNNGGKNNGGNKGGNKGGNHNNGGNRNNGGKSNGGGNKHAGNNANIKRK